MNILLPWNLSYFIPLNAFHPLYRAILNYKGKHRLIVPNHDLTYSQYNYLKSQGLYDNKHDKELWWLKELDKDLKVKFYNFFSKREINYASYLPGDVEFLHTAPITKGDRPFVVHLESFLPFFMPFSFQGGNEGIAKTLHKIKGAYKKLLLKNCIAIVSHNKHTLKELSDFFNDSKIDKLLTYIPIGVPFEKLNVKKDEKTTFLFIASAHQNINNFIYKGGMVAIDTAMKLLEKESDKYKFIFRTRRPQEEEFYKYNINIEKLKKYENEGKIIWIESKLSEKGIQRLFAKADFLFLANISLHSDAVLRAMMYGVIPIVTDIDGYKIYLNENECIMIDGIKDRLYKKDKFDNTQIIYDDYKNFPKMHHFMVNQIIEKLALFDENKKIEISKTLRKKFENSFNQNKMIKPLFDIFPKSNINDMDIFEIESKNRNILHLGEDFIKDLQDSWFQTTPHPHSLFYTGFGEMRKIYSFYLFFPSSQEYLRDVLYSFSPLNLAEHRYSKPINQRVEVFKQSNEIIDYLHQHISPQVSPQGFNNIAYSSNITVAKVDCPYCNSDLKGLKKRYFFFKNKIKNYLQAFPLVYYFSRCSISCLKSRYKELKDKRSHFKYIIPITPIIINSIDNYNIVKYKDTYYAIPHELGDVKVDKDDLTKLKGILIDRNYDNIEKEIIKKRTFIKIVKIKIKKILGI